MTKAGECAQKTLYIVSWDPDMFPVLEDGVGFMGPLETLLILAPEAVKGKDVTKLRMLAQPLEYSSDALSSYGLGSRLESEGYSVQPGVPSVLSQLVGDDMCHYLGSVKVLKYVYGTSLTVRGVMDVVERMPDSDGRNCLSDLLHQRSGLLFDRLADLGQENLVGLFRAAASEFRIMLSLASLLDDGKKPDAALSELEITDDARKTHYLQMARHVGRKRLVQMLDVAGKAIPLLQSSLHDRMVLAQYMALRICSI